MGLDGQSINNMVDLTQQESLIPIKPSDVMGLKN